MPRQLGKKSASTTHLWIFLIELISFIIFFVFVWDTDWSELLGLSWVDTPPPPPPLPTPRATISIILNTFGFGQLHPFSFHYLSMAKSLLRLWSRGSKVFNGNIDRTSLYNSSTDNYLITTKKSLTNIGTHNPISTPLFHHHWASWPLMFFTSSLHKSNLQFILAPRETSFKFTANLPTPFLLSSPFFGKIAVTTLIEGIQSTQR